MVIEELQRMDLKLKMQDYSQDVELVQWKNPEAEYSHYLPKITINSKSVFLNEQQIMQD